MFARESARILVKGSHGSTGADWYLLGQSTAMRKVCSGVRFLDEDDERLKLDGAASHDLRSPWPLYVESAMATLLLCLACLLVSFLGLRRRHTLAKRTLPIIALALAANCLVAGGGYLLLGLRRESLAPLVDAALYLALFSALLAAEELFFKALALAAAAGLTACALHDCVVFRDQGWQGRWGR
jgi:hypothetical protein